MIACCVSHGGGTADLSGLGLTDEAYGNPLKVHVAVLLAIRGEVYPTAADVMARFLDREMGHWLRRRTEHGIDQVSAPLARQVVALATLTQPEIEVVPRLLSAIPDLEDAGGLVRGNVGNWLAELFGRLPDLRARAGPAGRTAARRHTEAAGPGGGGLSA